MSGSSESASTPLSNADLARVLSPLLLFLAHVAYLVFWSPDPFLNKWLDGSFSFFVSLVLCNIIRARVVAAAASRGGRDDADDGDPDGVEDRDGGGGSGDADRPGT